MAHILRHQESRPEHTLSLWIARAVDMGADWLLRLLFFVGVPYAAMLSGAADFPAQLGLARLDWPAAVGRGSVLGLAIFAALSGIVWYSSHTLRAMGMPAVPFAPPQRGWMFWISALCQEAHWAFYRLPGILATGDYFVGTWTGALLVMLEQAGDPRWRRRAGSAQHSLEAWRGVALMVGMSAAFYFTRNFFVLWVVHAIVDWGSGKVEQRLAEAGEGTTTG